MSGHPLLDIQWIKIIYCSSAKNATTVLGVDFHRVFQKDQISCQMLQYAAKNMNASMRIIVKVPGKLTLVAAAMLSPSIRPVQKNSTRDTDIPYNKLTGFIFLPPLISWHAECLMFYRSSK